MLNEQKAFAFLGVSSMHFTDAFSFWWPWSETLMRLFRGIRHLWSNSQTNISVLLYQSNLRTKSADGICWQKTHLLTREICWQNLLTKNKSADEGNLLTESADKKQICWRWKNLAGAMDQHPELKPSHHASQPRAGAHVPSVLNLTPGLVLGPDLPGLVALCTRYCTSTQ